MKLKEEVKILNNRFRKFFELRHKYSLCPFSDDFKEKEVELIQELYELEDIKDIERYLNSLEEGLKSAIKKQGCDQSDSEISEYLRTDVSKLKIKFDPPQELLDIIADISEIDGLKWLWVPYYQLLLGCSEIKLSVDELRSKLETKGFSPDESSKLAQALDRYRKYIKCTNKEIIGESPSMRKLKEQIWDTVFTHSFLIFIKRSLGNEEELKDFLTEAVHICGPTGSGKEKVAEAIHEITGRGGSLIKINCGAIPQTLIESELFGIGKRVATEVRGRIGKFEAADNGTIFLDEIGTTPLTTQVALLRAIETKEITKVGETTPQKFDVKIVSATNANLLDLIESKEFREDLFWRIWPIEIRTPHISELTDGDRKEILKRIDAATWNDITDEDSKDEFLKIIKSNIDRFNGNIRELHALFQRFFHTGRLDQIADYFAKVKVSISKKSPLSMESLFEQAFNEKWSIKKLQEEYAVWVINECKKRDRKRCEILSKKVLGIGDSKYANLNKSWKDRYDQNN